MIKLNNVTLKYSNNKGIFDIDFSINQGEVVGYLGPNGAGKTTTIRTLLGFMKPNNGECIINGFDCFRQAVDIQQFLGYLPSEITFLDGMNGEEYLNLIGKMRKITDFSIKNKLVEMFELSLKGNIKKYSKGMKQKLGIISTFLHNPKVIILDEPTSGLDPLMQNRFIDLIKEQKSLGKTILMSSHIFDEIEKVCDRCLIIKEGRIIANSDIEQIKNNKRKKFIVKSNEIEQAKNLLIQNNFIIDAFNDNSLEIYITQENTDKFIKLISNIKINSLDIALQSLEEVFINFYN